MGKSGKSPKKKSAKKKHFERFGFYVLYIGIYFYIGIMDLIAKKIGKELMLVIPTGQDIKEGDTVTVTNGKQTDKLTLELNKLRQWACTVKMRALFGKRNCPRATKLLRHVPVKPGSFCDTLIKEEE